MFHTIAAIEDFTKMMKCLFTFFAICLLSAGDGWANEKLTFSNHRETVYDELFMEETTRVGLNVGGDSTDIILSGGFANFAYIITEGSLFICPGDTITLSAGGGTAGSTYLWTTGATTSSIQVSATGVYGLKITTYKGKGKGGKCTSVAVPVAITVSSLISDLNNDGNVDVLDYIIFLGVFNSPCPACAEDFIADGLIDTRDYLRWVSDIFKTCNN